MTLSTLIKEAYKNNSYLPFRSIARAIYWRLRTNPRRFYRCFKPVVWTRPLKCNPAAPVELHTLTCHDHVFMYITATKSLLRFVSELAVVVHDDGSLTPEDIRSIELQIIGVKVIRRHDADELVRQRLALCPKTASYRAAVINSLELTDHLLLADREKIVITNSDTLFLRRPDQVLRWIEADDGEVLCVYEKQPVQQAEFLAKMQCSFPPHLTLALVCLCSPVACAAEIEETLNQVGEDDQPWFIGQNSLPILIGKKLSAEKVRFLDPEAYQASGEFSGSAIFRHYWTSIVNLRSQYCADAKKVIAELRSGD
jgi:hypothetical protein